MSDIAGNYTDLASYRRCLERINNQWAPFQTRRDDCLRHGNEVEVVAEEILRDLFTQVLDWSPGDLLRQRGRADMILSKNLRKFLVLEAKRPGSLWLGRQTLGDALHQARRYADEQRVTCIGASDGRFIYVADIENGSLKERVILDLEHPEPPAPLWWLSVHGIYRPCEEPPALPEMTVAISTPMAARSADSPIHPRYRVPAECFAYVGDSNNPRTWSLPYRNADGSIDERRLPKAIQAVLTNYRGVKVSRIPEQAIPGVLRTLARAADSVGRMPPQAIKTAPIYVELSATLAQMEQEQK